MHCSAVKPDVTKTSTSSWRETSRASTARSRRNTEQLDFHTVTFDSEGAEVQPQPGSGRFRYPPEGSVDGAVSGVAVRCISITEGARLPARGPRRGAGNAVRLARLRDIVLA